MCRGCWEEEGCPTEVPPAIDEFLQLHSRLFQIYPTGGPLHVELEDWNLEEINPSYELYPDLPGDQWTLIERLAEVLSGMTIPQRYAALARAHGYLKPVE